MKVKNYGLLVLAIVSMAAVIFFAQKPDDTAPLGKLLPDLKGRIGEIERLTIATRDSQIDISKAESGWFVAQRDGYPANMAKMSELLNGLADAKLLEKKTTRQANYAALNVDEISAEEGGATLVTATMAGDDTFSVLLGKTSSGSRGVFTRKPGQDQVWLVDKEIEIQGLPEEWLDPVIVNMGAETIARVEHYDVSGKLKFAAVKPMDEGEVELLDIPDGRALKYASVANQLMASLVNVRLKDVRLHDEVFWQDSGRTVYQLHAGTELVVRTKASGQEYYLHIEYPQSPDGAGNPEDSLRFERWDFRVASNVFDDFNKDIEDFLQPVEDSLEPQ